MNATYFTLAATALRRPWRKAIAEDLLLSDVLIAESLRTRPNFASLFLNSAVRIQHHYLLVIQAFSAARIMIAPVIAATVASEAWDTCAGCGA